MQWGSQKNSIVVPVKLAKCTRWGELPARMLSLSGVTATTVTLYCCLTESGEADRAKLDRKDPVARTRPIMKMPISQSLVASSAVLVAFAACAGKPAADPTAPHDGAPAASSSGGAAATAPDSVPGRIEVNAAEATATVVAIDRVTRVIILQTDDGKKAGYSLGPDVVNFDQIKVGDQVRATLVHRTALFLSKSGKLPPQTSDNVAIARAQLGAKPGMKVVETTDITVKVLSIDRDKREVTVQTADKDPVTVVVDKSIDLTPVAVGDNVFMRVTKSLAIVVEKK